MILIVNIIFILAQENKANVQELLGVEVIYENDAFSVENIFIDFGYASESLNVGEGDFIIKELDANNNVLNNFYFNIPVILSEADPSWFDPETGEQIIIPEAPGVNFQEVYYLPYVEGIRFVGIYESASGSELVKVDISDYVLCGDGNCQTDAGEDNIICPRDCEISPEEERPPFNLKSWILNNKTYILIILGGVLLLILLILIFILIFKKRKAKKLLVESSVKQQDNL